MRVRVCLGLRSLSVCMRLSVCVYACACLCLCTCQCTCTYMCTCMCMCMGMECGCACDEPSCSSCGACLALQCRKDVQHLHSARYFLPVALSITLAPGSRFFSVRILSLLDIKEQDLPFAKLA